MKIRTGFVSNSSSSSFCVAKCFIPKEDLQEFKRIVDGLYDEDSGEGSWIGESSHYYCGELRYGSSEEILDFCREKKIPYFNEE